MLRWIIIAILVVMLALPLAGIVMKRARAPETGVATPLHEAAAGGNDDDVPELVRDGADVNARDEEGRTPLHLSARGGHNMTTQALLDAGADASLTDVEGKTPMDYAVAAGHDGVAGRLKPVTPARALPVDDGAQRLKPDLKYPDLASFQQTIGQPGVLLKSEHVYLFAPKSRESGATVVFPILAQAYDELYKIVGVHTKYIMVFYCFPMGHPDARGSTSECTVWYGDDNLDLDRQSEWTKHKVPHVSGMI